MKIELNEIKIQPEHPIFKYKPIKNLLNKRNSSQQKPIVLKHKNYYLLYSGEKIYRNAKNKNKSKIDCNIKENIKDIQSINLSEIYFSGLKTPTKIAKDFIKFRKTNNISQQELSRRTGITPGAIHHYEKVQSSGPQTSIDYSHLIECNSTDPGAQSVSNVEYERRLQDKKRQIKLLQPNYLNNFIDEFRRLIVQ